MRGCSSCGGRGYVTRGGIGPNGPVMGNVPCPVCNRGRELTAGEAIERASSGVMQIIGMVALVFLGIPAIVTVIAAIVKGLSQR